MVAKIIMKSILKDAKKSYNLDELPKVFFVIDYENKEGCMMIDGKKAGHEFNHITKKEEIGLSRKRNAMVSMLERKIKEASPEFSHISIIKAMINLEIPGFSVSISGKNKESQFIVSKIKIKV
jgi:hypothetical protein